MAEREPTYVLQPGFAREYHAGLRGEQHDMFPETASTTRDLEIPPMPTHNPTKTAAYQIEHAYHDKHFPTISQEQRDAARATLAAATHDSAQLQIQMMMDQGRSRNQGMER